MSTTEDSKGPGDRSGKGYTWGQVVLHNLPYMGMLALGGAMVWLWPGPWWAVGYVAYGIAGTVWIMVFVCPYCRFWGTRSCPCGYGVLAARLRERAGCEMFDQKFRRHIPVIVPLWFLPPVATGLALSQSLDWTLIALAVLFLADAFVVLPLVSTRCGCKDCPQRSDCPWMGRGRSEVA